MMPLHRQDHTDMANIKSRKGDFTQCVKYLRGNKSLPIDLFWHFYTFGSNWGTKRSVTTGGKSLTCVTCWIERGKEMGPVDASGPLGPRRTVDKYLHEPWNTQSFVFPPPVQKKLFPHFAQITIAKKRPRHKQNEPFKRCDLKRGDLKKWESVCWAWRKKKKVCFPGNGHLAAVGAKPQHSQRAKPR